MDMTAGNGCGVLASERTALVLGIACQPGGRPIRRSLRIDITGKRGLQFRPAHGNGLIIGSHTAVEHLRHLSHLLAHRQIARAHLSQRAVHVEKQFIHQGLTKSALGTLEPVEHQEHMQRDHVKPAVHGVGHLPLIIEPGMPRGSHNCLVGSTLRGRGALKETFEDHIDYLCGVRNRPVFNGFGREMGYSVLLMTRSSRMPLFRLLAAVLFSFGVAACSPTIEHRGYIAKPGAFNQIDSGMSKLEVEGILGSPSTTASVKFNGDSYYYITSTTKSRAFLSPTETNREVIAIRFDREDRVQSFAQYGLQDGRVIDINTRRSVVVGEDTSLITQLLRGARGAKTGPILGNKL